MAVRDNDESGRGCLYLVATPIGNLEDITLRALRTLKEADAIACEDTRQTQKLLGRYEIRKRLVSYHEHNEAARAPELVEEIERGTKVALVSDAGTPVISDPGQRLVALCMKRGIPVIPIPGPSALVAALAASGLASEQFAFVGFLPQRSGERRRTLERLRQEPRTMVLYEAPHRLAGMLRDAAETLGVRRAVIARELTKVHEEFVRGTLEELAALFAHQKIRGEITVVIGPASEAPKAASETTPIPLGERVEQIMREHRMDRKAALKQAAKERGLSKREAYKLLLKEG